MRFGKKIIKFSTYFSLYILLTLFFTYLKFPYNKIQHSLFSFIEKRTSISMTAQELKPYFFTGINAKGVKIRKTSKQEGEDLLKLDDLKIRFSPCSILTKSPTIKFSATSLGGKIDGKVKWGRNNQDLNLNMKSWNIASLSAFFKEYGINLYGKIDGNATFLVNSQNIFKSSGNLKFSISQLALDPGSYIKAFLGLNKESLSFGNFTGGAKIENQTLTLEKIQAQGGDIMGLIEGTINLKNPFELSRLDCNAKLKFSDELANKVNSFITGFSGKERDSEGYFNFPLRGTIQSLNFNWMSR